MAKYRVETDGGVYEVETDDPTPSTGSSVMSASNIPSFDLQGSNGATQGLSAATQTFGVQPTDASSPQGAALKTVMNQVMAPARLSQTLGSAGGPASQYAQNLMAQAGQGPFMQKASGLVAATAVDPRSYAVPGGDEAPASVIPENYPFSKVGEMVSGTRASNLDRAYQGGLAKTYLQPQSMAASKAQYAQAYEDVLGKYLTPEERTGMLINPRGEANSKIADVYQQWLSGQPISAQDAVAAKTAIGTVFPSYTAKNMSKIARLTDFEHNLDGVIQQSAPDFANANSNYAGSALRSNLSKPMPVNKSNPEEYSKLARYLVEGLGVGGAAIGHGVGAAIGGAATLLGTSPLVMGTIAAGSGDIARLVQRLADNPAARATVMKYVDSLPDQQGTGQ